LIRITRAQAFILSIAAAFLAPGAIPGVGIDFTYLFILVIVLLAWFVLKWTSVNSLALRGGLSEILIGGVAVASIYAYKLFTQTRLGLLDLVVIFGGLVVGFYGVRAFKLFWVPAAYGIVLLAGYQIENITPNYVALQDWMAGLMSSSMQAVGVSSTVSGHVVVLNSGANSLALDVEGDCTGIQGILAFGLLSTMALLDTKPKLSRVIPLFVVGFVGVFLINLLRLFGVFLTFEYLGVDAGTAVHVYLGYTLFIVWVLVFWSLAFRYLANSPRPLPPTTGISSGAAPIVA